MKWLPGGGPHARGMQGDVSGSQHHAFKESDTELETPQIQQLDRIMH